MAYVDAIYSTPVRVSPAKTTAPIFRQGGQAGVEQTTDRLRTDTVSRSDRTVPRSNHERQREQQTSDAD